MASHSEHNHQSGEIAKPNVAHIWKTFWILLAATAVEFIIAFSTDNKMLRVTIFLTLTIVKAFYIVAEFMHLKHEAKVLIWSVLIPIIFIIWFVVALLVEGNAIYGVRF